jgi:hypothetical protein
MAIRKPEELTPDLMEEWAKADIGSRIVVTGTRANCLEDLANCSESYGVLCAIETVIAVRSNIIGVELIQCASEGDFAISAPIHSDAYVMCFKTIREALSTIGDEMPLAWIHLGHGDYDYQIEEDDEGEWGDDYATLSNGEEEGDWIRTEEISKIISEGTGSMLFCILPVCCSSNSGDVLQNNSNILAIHATRTDKPHSVSEQLLEMPEWMPVSLRSMIGAGRAIHKRLA